MIATVAGLGLVAVFVVIFVVVMCGQKEEVPEPVAPRSPSPQVVAPAPAPERPQPAPVRELPKEPDTDQDYSDLAEVSDNVGFHVVAGNQNQGLCVPMDTFEEPSDDPAPPPQQELRSSIIQKGPDGVPYEVVLEYEEEEEEEEGGSSGSGSRSAEP